MQPHPRYEIIEQIAAGDFATVYRARDKELNRDVAVKQIHPQFLTDQRQLERYWQEAQMLASLEHPNITTIYDIDRSRGWLILELLNGSLADRAAGQPMDLDFLRVALVCSLQALKFLHDNGIVHGDVKPTNLLIDKRNWVKLGDFGLAQRAANDQGSLLKGATKYIAPERVNEHLGPVGPASDLYSLGFSLYELMCGDAFDSLFPGLGAFGRDKQIAWMMWHAAPDRMAPEISRVLQGVPEDLQYVIQKLIQKVPSQRYKSADEALYDLKSGMGLQAGPSPEELAAQAALEEEEQKRKRRKMVIIAACVGVLLLIGAFLIPKPEKKPAGRHLRPVEGVIKHLLDDRNKIVLDNDVTVTYEPKAGDQIYLNEIVAELSMLDEGNYLRVKILKDRDTNKPYQVLKATRPTDNRGEIVEVQSGKSTFVMKYKARNGEDKTIAIYVPDDIVIQFNKQPEFHGKKMTPADLRAGDQVFVRHDDQDERRKAVALEVTRVVTATGRIRGVDRQLNQMTVVTRDGVARGALTREFSGTCEVEINGKQYIRNQKLRPTDLHTDDEVVVYYDTHFVKVVATRLNEANGTVAQVLASHDILEVQQEGQDAPTPFAVAGKTEIKLGQETVALGELQQGDEVDINFDAADIENPAALNIQATRPIDRNRWAVVVGVGQYRDKSLTSVPHLDDDAEAVFDRLVKRYRVAQDQALLLENPDRERIEQAVADFLGRVPAESRLVVYFAAHAYEFSGTSYLAGSDFEQLRIDQTGVPLAWLLAEVDNCAAMEKVVLLDTCHDGNGSDLKHQPSSAEQVQVLYDNRRAPLPARSTVITSCQPSQRGVAKDGHGEFSRALALAYRGDADADGNTLIEIPELSSFLTAQLRERTAGQQAPKIFAPRQAVAARLSDESKRGLREMATEFVGEKFDLDEIQLKGLEIQRLEPGDPEPELLYGLALLKAGHFAEAFTTFKSAWGRDPKRLLPLEAMIWCLYEQGQFRTAVSGLSRLAAAVPRQLDADNNLPPAAAQLFTWIGRLREYAGSAAKENDRPKPVELEKIDNAIAGGGFHVERAYRKGRDDVLTIVREVDERIAKFPEQKLQLERFERPRLDKYVSFDIGAAVERVLADMEKE